MSLQKGAVQENRVGHVLVGQVSFWSQNKVIPKKSLSLSINVQSFHFRLSTLSLLSLCADRRGHRHRATMKK